MTDTPTRWLLALPENDPFARTLARRFVRPGRQVEFCPVGTESPVQPPPAVVIVDLSLPGADALLRRFKLAPGGAVTAVLGLLPARDGDETPTTETGLRVRPDREAREPFSAVELAERVEELAAERLLRPELRTLALDYVPDLDRQDQAAELIELLLADAGLPEEPRFCFGCGVREALDNARLHGSRPGASPDRARVWFESDARQVMVAVSDGGHGPTTPQLPDGSESPSAAARRRNASGKPGGLGMHIMRRMSDEVRYEPASKLVMLVKRLVPAGVR